MSGAIISPCKQYRYALERDGWIGAGTVLFVMLNPSTADADQDDPTIRRCVGFARSWGFARLRVANLYGLRATRPELLALARDPIGPQNDYWLKRLSSTAECVVAAWGANRHASADRVAEVLTLLNSNITCLGRTKAGAPRHPLYVRADTKLVPLSED